MALRLEKLCENGPDLWLNLQKRHDLLEKRYALHQARREFAEKFRKIPMPEVA